jgi:hypothetical protein
MTENSDNNIGVKNYKEIDILYGIKYFKISII